MWMVWVELLGAAEAVVALDCGAHGAASCGVAAASDPSQRVRPGLPVRSGGSACHGLFLSRAVSAPVRGWRVRGRMRKLAANRAVAVAMIAKLAGILGAA